MTKTNSLLLDHVAETTSHRDRDQLDDAIARLLLQFLEAQSVTLLRLIEDGQIKRVERSVSVGREGGPLLAHFANDIGQLPALDDVPSWLECVNGKKVVQSAGTDADCLTFFPIQGEREVLGILALDTAAPLATRDAALVQGILRILKNHLALLDYGERDTLTGLLNRKTFEAHFEKLRQRLIAAGEVTREPSWLALLDIDKFKSINDSHGHLFGDEVLLLISQLMKRNFRGDDELFRFGGEEFLIVLDHATEDGAQIALERLRVAIETYPFPQIGRVTASIGCTRIDMRDGPTTCVERADAALYYSKAHGRNMVRFHEALIAANELIAKPQSEAVELF